ncbi:MAG TPA: hypothetical protein GXX37_00725 [Clostridiaceae bacterium]|nr:hypothetical protein [Clostridiaceae bacterium]
MKINNTQYINQIRKKLLEYGKARITEKELRQYAPVTDYEDYYHIVIELVGNNIITPVKNSGFNGRRPPLYKKYNIIKPEHNYDDLIPEIRLLNDRLNIEGYLADPEKYKKHKPWLLPLDYFLKYHFQSLETPLSINERSFQIFKKEKVLKEDKELAAVLNFNPGLKEILNYYQTPEPFFLHDITNYRIRYDAKGNNGNCEQQRQQYEQKLQQHDQQLNILIIENKDTWYTLKNIMSHNLNCLAGIKFDSLIYGEGKKIARKMDSLTEFDKSFFNGVKTTYYYFGDLDYEGISIFYDLLNVNSMLSIKLMKTLYTAMLDASKDIIEELPITKDKQVKKAELLEWFVSFFNDEHQEIIKNILESDRYIPQEILNNVNFRELLKVG